MTDSIAREFARWSTALTYDDLPAAIVDKVKALLLQALVGGVYGGELPAMQDVVRLAAAEEGRPDGATILGSGVKASRVGAAYANTELMYGALLYDYFQAQTHPGPVLVSAALVNAELEGRDVRAVLTALAAGYEVTCRLADEFVPSTFARGYRPASVYPTIGAAVVTAKLMDLDEDGMLAAISLAANSVSGLIEGRGGATDSVIHLPGAVRQGVFAAVMASTGRVRGAETIIEGDAGFYNAVIGNNRGELRFSHEGRTRVDLDAVASDLGMTWRLLETTFHMYPLHGPGMPVIDLMTEMRARHKFDAGAIERVTVRMSYLDTVSPAPAFPRRVPAAPGPTSLHYYAAHVAVHGGFAQVGGKPYGHEGGEHGGHGAADERVLAFAREHVTVIGEYGRPGFSPQIEVRLKDGTTYLDEYPYARMYWDFDALVARLEAGSSALYPLGRARFDALVEAVRHAERLDSLASLHALVARGA